MLNLTDIRNLTRTEEPSTLTGRKTYFTISTINIPLSINAFLGNALIIAALPKVSFLHTPSKLLLGCLASTDLCVGLVAQPLYINYLLSTKCSKHCYYSFLLFNSTCTIFCGISLLTLTAISMDRLLAVLLGLRYRQVITLSRVWVIAVTIWFLHIAHAVILHYNLLYGLRIFSVEVILCIIASACCYMKIYRILHHHQAQVQQHIHQGQPNGEEIPLNIARYRRTVSSMIWVQISLLACYLPFGLVAGLSVITSIYTPLPQFTVDAALTLVMFNSTLNPFLYCWKMQEMNISSFGLNFWLTMALTLQFFLWAFLLFAAERLFCFPEQKFVRTDAQQISEREI